MIRLVGWLVDWLAGWLAIHIVGTNDEAEQCGNEYLFWDVGQNKGPQQ